MPVWWPFAVGGALVLTATLTPVLAGLARRFGVVDVPRGERKIHDRIIPFFGGLSIFAGLFVPMLIVLLAGDHLTAGEIDPQHFIGFFLGAIVLLVGGVFDDKFDLPPRFSILFPLIAATLAVGFGIGVEKITNPLGGAIVLGSSLSIMLTLVWLLGMTYTTKLLDGLDGLATGVTLIGAVMIALLALSEKFSQPDVAVFALIFGAALLGFLFWNIYPATIFLGEGGSTFLGFTLGVLAVIAGSKLATTLLVVGVPMLDVAFVAWRRFREGRKLTSGDRTHLHHLLLAAGLSQRTILAVYLGVATVFGITTLIFASWQKMIALGILVLLSGLAVSWLYKKYSREKYERTI
jgi:UDP-GlcNAc:undecaprenyl-phosphate/decaprenyl-phosphate GlcNAc-1-phosphate transferase